MKILGHDEGPLWVSLGKPMLGCLLSVALLFATLPQDLAANPQEQAPPPQDQAPPPQGQTSQGAPYTQQTPEQLQQLVAPIALYPDSLVAQILAAIAE